VLLSFCLATSHAQTPPDAPNKLTPQAAYEQAVRPFDIVRRAPQNWSEIELAALRTTTGQAKESCLASSPTDFTGDDLLAYARLCALGQAWEPVELAAYKYIQSQARQPAVSTSSATAVRSLSTAYDYEVQATLRLQKPVAAFRSCQTMLKTLPYDDLASEAVNSTVPYLQLSDTDEALALLIERQPILLSMLRNSASTPAFPPRTLYAEAIALPAMQQFANQQEAAAASYTDLEQALPATLTSDDVISIGESRRRYHLLGAHLPKIDSFAWLMDSTGRGIPPAINSSFGSATVLLLFPDWCNQCVALHTQFAPAWARLREDNVRFFALLAQPEAPPAPAPKEILKPVAKASGTSTKPAPFAGEKPGIPHSDLQLDVKPTAAALLAGSPTFAVAANTIDKFVANDFPFIVVADHDGTIRVIQPANETVLVPGGQIDQLADHVTQLWHDTKP